MCDALFGGGGNSDAAEAARRDEEARQARIRAGMGQIDQTFSQFNDDYFDTRSKAYLDYATPQLEDQFAKATEQLIFALSRGGNLNSSVAGERLADLTQQNERSRVGNECDRTRRSRWSPDHKKKKQKDKYYCVANQEK